MSYFVNSVVSSPAPYSAARPTVVRQGPINSYEDPRMACGFQSNYHLQRTCYPFWEEMATQEVPTGLEHCGSALLHRSSFPPLSIPFTPDLLVTVVPSGEQELHCSIELKGSVLPRT
ncbi:hypothetical protein mRhiFer1_004693 [Rhinolophus ferrumequinum]|uniref:Uncharacterized protein n=1 Tax=Rhinolophus ferrumequinum TaxID=59479 RepID=A0A7J7RP67_RHIFE|nr:hypothetical protein mRhiFer1_004693 [Rhinolophus ferrumequinum]